MFISNIRDLKILIIFGAYRDTAEPAWYLGHVSPVSKVFKTCAFFLDEMCPQCYSNDQRRWVPVTRRFSHQRFKSCSYCISLISRHGCLTKYIKFWHVDFTRSLSWIIHWIEIFSVAAAIH